MGGSCLQVAKVRRQLHLWEGSQPRQTCCLCKHADGAAPDCQVGAAGAGLLHGLGWHEQSGLQLRPCVPDLPQAGKSRLPRQHHAVGSEPAQPPAAAVLWAASASQHPSTCKAGSSGSWDPALACQSLHFRLNTTGMPHTRKHCSGSGWVWQGRSGCERVAACMRLFCTHLLQGLCLQARCLQAASWLAVYHLLTSSFRPGGASNDWLGRRPCAATAAASSTLQHARLQHLHRTACCQTMDAACCTAHILRRQAWCSASMPEHDR